jgi:hypothetical protein
VPPGSELLTVTEKVIWTELPAASVPTLTVTVSPDWMTVMGRFPALSPLSREASFAEDFSAAVFSGLAEEPTAAMAGTAAAVSAGRCASATTGCAKTGAATSAKTGCGAAAAAAPAGRSDGGAVSPPIRRATFVGCVQAAPPM